MLMDSVEFKNSEIGEPEEAEYPDAPIEAGVFIGLFFHTGFFI